jgi:hypothetical protein
MIQKLEALATLIADFREGEIPRPDADHVGRWIGQFEAVERELLLDELCHVWSQLYFSRQRAREFIRGFIKNDDLVGNDPAGYWSAANLLDIQKNGGSQRDMLELFWEELQAATGLPRGATGGGADYIYVDDALFTGGRIQTDLRAWLQYAPDRARVRIVVPAHHKFGEYKTREWLQAEARRLSKDITFEFWSAFGIENRNRYSRDSGVLWPTRLPREATGYDQGRFPLQLREPGGASTFYSSEVRRDVLEQAFVKAGLKIRSFSANPKPVLRPLGFGPFAMGFGSLFLSWRNCPNNAPLALWWGGKANPPWHPFNKWHPLVPRKTYGNDGDL